MIEWSDYVSAAASKPNRREKNTSAADCSSEDGDKGIRLQSDLGWPLGRTLSLKSDMAAAADVDVDVSSLMEKSLRT